MQKRIKTENYIVVKFPFNKKIKMSIVLPTYIILYYIKGRIITTDTRHTKYKFITILDIL